ncbi:hypothetical protein [Microbacterium sp.]|uniref:hypothetical protein n=1 Tax=Microbacterium sp. TaxID=51671 RepID=UPI003A8C417B
MRAPIGYLNVHRTDDNGREVRTVEVDLGRASLIRWAFEQHATGETSVAGLLRDLAVRGLMTKERGGTRTRRTYACRVFP